MLAAGTSPAEIARRLQLAHSTVGYHVRRLEQSRIALDERRSVHADTTVSAVHQVSTREDVRRLLDAGLSRLEAARRLGVSKATVSYHARRLGYPVDARGARRYDWSLVQLFYDEGHSVTECEERFGFSRQTWNAAVTRGAVVSRPHAMPIAELFVAGVPRSRQNLKRRLIAAGLKDVRCETCGLAEWRGAALALSLHHVNGDRDDNRLENLRLLCPNCHSQTENFSGRSGGNRGLAAARPAA